MDPAVPNNESPSVAPLRTRARRDAGLFSVLVLLAVSIGVLGLWFTERSSLHDDFRHYLVGVAQVAATYIDPTLHASLRRPEQLNGPAYRSAIEPLLQLKRALPDLHYVYTVVRDGDRVRFVLESSDPGSTLPNGEAAQSGVWAVYDHTDPAMVAALGTADTPAHAEATDTPYEDEWGAFMTGWAPLRDASGQRAVVGVDIDASLYVHRLRAARNWALAGLIPAALVVGLLGGLYYRARLRDLISTAEAVRAAEAAKRSAALLARERERLNAVIEGTNVATWEVDASADALIVDRTFEAMLGHADAPGRTYKASEWLRSTVTDDAVSLTKAIAAAASSENPMFSVELRLLHHDGHKVWVVVRGRIVERTPDGRPRRLVGIQMDVTARKAAEHAMFDSELRFRSLFELSPVGICRNDFATGRFLEFNEALLAPTGYSGDELLAMTYWDLTPQEYSKDEAAQLQSLASTARYGPYEKVYKRKDGTTYPVLLSGIRTVDASGRPVIWSIVQDISQRKAIELELARAATYDRLTGLANRARFMDLLDGAIRKLHEDPTQQFTILFLDFDRFKLINDSYGHKAGDELLRQIATRLGECLRSSDRIATAHQHLICRFGGDEFLVMLRGIGSVTQATAVAERLLNHLARPYTISGHEVHSTASIGVITSDQCRTSAEDVVRNADVAMYEAKRLGRGCMVVFSEAMHTRLARNLTIESELRRGLGTPALRLVYQPIVDLATGRMKSAEALLRWSHPTLGEISPSEFIPVAEESGLIVAVGQWVMHEACTTLAQWRRTDPTRAPDTVSVNVSLAELSLGQRLLERIEHVLALTGLPPQCLQLEVTEREVMRNPASTLELMRSLNRAGVRLAMDDFGTGTSSLAFLRDFPFHTVKIDRSFVNGVGDNPEMLAIMHATITLVENLGMISVAEGVELPSQAAILQSMGCRYAQGYLFSRPVRPEYLLDAGHRHLGRDTAHTDPAVSGPDTTAVGVEGCRDG